jgi:hypothetical protein
MKPADTTIEMSNMVSTPKNPFTEHVTSSSENPFIESTFPFHGNPFEK